MQSGSRRGFLQQALRGVAGASIVLGFDLAAGVWVTAGAAEASAAGFSRLPALDGTLFLDADHLDAAQEDFGHIVRHRPAAVLLPGSVDDIVKVVRFARRHGLQVAMRGISHAPFGQAQVDAGVIVDSSSLAQLGEVQSSPEGAWLDVGPGAQWRAVIQAAFARGFTPRVLTDFQGLTVGGTLTIGGIGGRSQRFGVQADNVLELEVVTGRGERVTCSEASEPQLFNAVLAGLGQAGLIVRARVPLIAAPAQVRVFNLFYDDIQPYVSDQLRLLAEQRFEHLQGQVVAHPSGTGWRFMIEAGAYFSPPATPDPVQLLAGLNDVRADLQDVTQSYLEFAFRLDSLIEFLISIGVWDFPHPWLDVFVPASKASGFVGGLLTKLTAADTGGGPILFYPIDTRQVRRPFFRLPDEHQAFSFNLLRTADPPTAEKVAALLADNRALYDQLVQLGGTRYANGALPFDAQDWRRHFGARWRALADAKRRFDPDHVLTPGQGIFPGRRAS